MRVVFMGTPDFAVPVLQALIAAGHAIPAVYTQPPRPAGRGRKLTRSAVHRAAEDAGIEVRTPGRFREAAVIDGFRALAPDIAVVVAYGQILPQAALDVPPLGCLNAHASLLPRWRGAAPIQRAIMAGDGETGVCVMRMEAGLDTGPVLARDRMAIGPADTAGSLHDTLSAMSARLMAATLSRLANGPVATEPQPEHGVTYAAKIEKTEAHISFDQPAAVVSAHIRGLSPFPGAWAEIAGERVKVLMVERAPHDPPAGTLAGTVLDDRLTVACREGALRLTRLQRAGRGAQDAEEMLRGFAVPAGTVLG
ncbi:MAG: methionyl-tRNA formyltransferase [Pseudomonadota bacterium]